MQTWLLKADPETYGIRELQRDQKTDWNGIRNYQARNFIRQMQPGDQALVYEGQSVGAVVGLAEVLAPPLPDPDPNRKGDWMQVPIAWKTTFSPPISVRALKDDPVFQDLLLFKQGRLSVMPVRRDQFDRVLSLANADPG